MKTDFFSSVLKQKKFFLDSGINAQSNKKIDFNQRKKIQSAKSNKNKKGLILSPNHIDIKSIHSNDEVNIDFSNRYLKTINSEKKRAFDDLKYNLKTVKTEAKENSLFDKMSNNNLSIYSTLWYNEYPKRKKIYYFLNNKKNEKKAKELLKKSENFNKYNDDRYIIGILNKFKNKTINVGEHKKYQ